MVLPDAGPLITLAYADALDLLLKPGWPVRIVDMVLHEVTRNDTPTSAKIGAWVAERSIPIESTRTFAHYCDARAEALSQVRKANLGEIAVQEAMNALALAAPGTTGVFLIRGPQDRTCQLFIAGQLPQGEHPGLAAVPGGEGLDRFRRRYRAGGDLEWP